jgi:hypothetical protein
MKYIVRVILPDGKNKMVVEEEYTADSFYTDSLGNLVLEDAAGALVVEFHSYNWLSIKPAVDTSVTSDGMYRVDPTRVWLA